MTTKPEKTVLDEGGWPWFVREQMERGNVGDKATGELLIRVFLRHEMWNATLNDGIADIPRGDFFRLAHHREIISAMYRVWLRGACLLGVPPVTVESVVDELMATPVCREIPRDEWVKELTRIKSGGAE